MKQLIFSMIFLLITNTLEKPTISTLNSTETTEFIDYTTSDPVLESTISYDENIGDLLNVKNIPAEENPIDQQVAETTGNPNTTTEINTSYDDKTECDTGRVALAEDTSEHNQTDANEQPQNVTNPDVTTDAAFTSVSNEISFQRGEPLKEMKTSDNLYQKPNKFIINTGNKDSAATYFQKNVDDGVLYAYINSNKQAINKKQSTTENKSVFGNSNKSFVRRMMSEVVPLHDYDTLKRFKEIGKRTKVPRTMRSRQKTIVRTHLPIYNITPHIPLRLTAKQADFKSYGNDVKSVSLKKNVLKEVARPLRGFSISSHQLNKLGDVFLKLAKATYVSTDRLQSLDRNDYNYVGK